MPYCFSVILHINILERSNSQRSSRGISGAGKLSWGKCLISTDQKVGSFLAQMGVTLDGCLGYYLRGSRFRVLDSFSLKSIDSFPITIKVVERNFSHHVPYPRLDLPGPRLATTRIWRREEGSQTAYAAPWGAKNRWILAEPISEFTWNCARSSGGSGLRPFDTRPSPSAANSGGRPFVHFASGEFVRSTYTGRSGFNRFHFSSLNSFDTFQSQPKGWFYCVKRKLKAILLLLREW